MPLPTTKQKFPPHKKWPLLFKTDKGELLSLHSCSKEINIIPVLTLNNLLFYPVVAISLFHCWPGRHLDHLEDDDAISSHCPQTPPAWPLFMSISVNHNLSITRTIKFPDHYFL